MTKKKVAVCFSGQLRTWEKCLDNALSFFEGDNEHEYDFFYHSWDQSEPRIKYDNFQIAPVVLDRDVFDKLNGFLKPKKFEISSPLSPGGNGSPYSLNNRWVHLFYSLRKSIEQKELYEQETGVKYDLLVKTRFDIVFRPGTKFNVLSHLNDYGFVYFSHFDRPDFENFNVNLRDIFFFGDNVTITTLAHQSYLYSLKISRLKVFKDQFNEQDELERAIGPGVIMNRACEQMNFKYQMFDLELTDEVIVRENYTGPKVMDDESYENAKNIHFDFYEN